MGLLVGQFIVVSNENDVLYEFFIIGSYYVCLVVWVVVMLSFSMDIGKVSNFECYFYLIVGVDVVQMVGWWDEVGVGCLVELCDMVYWLEIQSSGFCVGKSIYVDWLVIIWWVDEQFGCLIDFYIVDGVLVGEGFWCSGVLMVCLEIVLFVKFEEMVCEVVGCVFECFICFVGIESKECFCDVLFNDVVVFKVYLVVKFG